ncbi:MAG: DNA-directed RNA polymerase subunit beta' [Candidatus Paceibacterota bacterium]
MFVEDINSFAIKLASPKDIMAWSSGEVKKPETINYRTQRPEKDGLFCEKIFGPVKDYRCACGKYRGIRYKGQVCDRCGVEITSASVRRERMGYISLAAPVSHIWFLRSTPSLIGLTLDISEQQLEKVIYFAGYIITEVHEGERDRILKEIEEEYQAKLKEIKNLKKQSEKEGKDQELADIEYTKITGELKDARDKAKQEVNSIKALRVLSEKEYTLLGMKFGEVFEAGTGAETVRKLFEKIDIKETMHQIEEELADAEGPDKKKLLLRLRLFKGLFANNLRPEWMFMTVLPVLPPNLRPMVQLDGERYASSDLNDLYRRVINRNNRLQYLLEIDAPEVIVRNEKRMLQEAVDALIDNGMRKGQTTTATTGGKRLLKSLSDMLKGKKGRFRQNLLGKRVDYSARSVIAAGPDLNINHCALPKEMALELFKPFVISKLLQQGLAFNIRGATRLIEQQIEEVWAALEEVVKDKVVLLNRAPTLHRLSIQGFYPTLIEDKVIRIHPLVCEAFNADFDGDQMAVHLPLSEQAQKEAHELMLSGNNLLKPATGTPIMTLRLEMVLGCFWLTSIREGAKGEGKVFCSKNEAIMAWDNSYVDIRAKVKVRIANQLIETTVGRILFNNALPEGYPFVNDTMDKDKISKLLGRIINSHENQIAINTIDRVKNLGFEYATLSGTTWGMDDLIIPKEKKEILAEAQKKVDQIVDYYERGFLSAEEKGAQVIEIWQKAKNDLEKLIPASIPSNGHVTNIVKSGSRGSWAQPVQMAGMKGLVINPAGQTMEMPVKSSFKEGLNILEYFISTHGARKGTADTALRTSAAGYLTRRLVDVAHGMIVSEEDCADKEGLIMYRKHADEIGQNFSYKIVGRYTLDNIEDTETKKVLVKKGEIIDWDAARRITDLKIAEVRVRTTMSCQTISGVCAKCYGWGLGNNQPAKLGDAVGVVAAQAIGEPGTQLTLKTFHSGGVAGVSDITQGLPRVEEILEARIPKGKAVVSYVDGKVKEIVTSPLNKIIKIENSKGDFVEYEIPPQRVIFVEKGGEVKKGMQLCEGSLDFKELFKLLGKDETARAIIRDIQYIYASQGVNIHDKHVESIVKQMFSRVRVKDPQDSRYIAGEIVTIEEILAENALRKPARKKEITFDHVFLGISNVSLTSESFLSAASFEQTSRVLIKAAIAGKDDKLTGLKENVIIGKLIPAGTGFHLKKSSKE